MLKVLLKIAELRHAKVKELSQRYIAESALKSWTSSYSSIIALHCLRQVFFLKAKPQKCFECGKNVNWCKVYVKQLARLIMSFRNKHSQ